MTLLSSGTRVQLRVRAQAPSYSMEVLPMARRPAAKYFSTVSVSCSQATMNLVAEGTVALLPVFATLAEAEVFSLEHGGEKWDVGKLRAKEARDDG